MADDNTATYDPAVSDEDLWDEFVSGDAGAAEVLAERYGDELYWYLFLSMGDQQRAAQGLLRTWELACDFRRSFEPFESFRSWIYAVATQNSVPATQSDMTGLVDLLDDVRRKPVLPRRGDVFFGIRDMLRWVRQPFLLVTVAGLTVRQTAWACNFTEDKVLRALAEGCRQLGRQVQAQGKAVKP